jgi:predicted Zn-dependent peptidase
MILNGLRKISNISISFFNFTYTGLFMPEITTLSSGLRVITDEMPNIRSVTMGVWIGVGARHEKPDEHGLAHLLEHMAFKGTKNRTAKDIAEQVENVGGFMNAYTSRNQTAYHMRILSQDATLSADILGDILKNSTFDETELDREKGVVLQEIGECEDSPDDVLFDNIAEICYGDHPLGKTILGTRESVTQMPRNHLFNYIQKYYNPQNMIFAASGGITHQEMCDLAEQYMDFAPQETRPTSTPPIWQGGLRAVHKDLEQVHLAFVMDGISYHDPLYFVSEVFSVIYGGGMSSRLFQEVREKHGLVYSISSFTSSLNDSGVFGFCAGTSLEDYERVLEISLEQLKDLSESMSDAEVNRAKAQLRSSLIMGLESPSGRVEALVKQQFIFNQFFTPDALIENIDSVTKQDLIDYAASLLKSKNPAFCTLGHVSDLTNAQAIIDRFFTK